MVRIIKQGNIYTQKPETKDAMALLTLVLVFLLAFSIFASSVAYSQSGKKSVTLQIYIFTKRDLQIAIQPANKLVLPGTEVAYTARITNPNPVTAQLELSYSVPEGWTITKQDTVTVNARSSATVTFRVRSPSGAALDSYSIGLRATSVSGISGSATAGYTLSERAPPEVELTPQSQTGPPGATLRYSARVTNSDPPGFDPSNLNIRTILPAGWIGVLRTADNRAGSTLSLRLDPGESSNIFLDVTSAVGAKQPAIVGVNVSTNNLWQEGYAEYKITLCGDGVCNIDEVCATDCGTETRFTCAKDDGRCEREEDGGASFSAITDFQFTKFRVCRRSAGVQQCESSRCGFGNACICEQSSSILSNIGSCSVRCVDDEGDYYIYAKGPSDSARTIYNYSFTCPFVDMQAFRQLVSSFTASLDNYEKALSAQTEYVNTNPAQRSSLQPCLSAYNSVVSDLRRHVSYLNAVQNSPAISNTTEARTRSEQIKRSIEERITSHCSAGVSGILDITSMSYSQLAEARTEASAMVEIRNTANIRYYGYSQCVFSKGLESRTVNSSCTSFEPGATSSFTVSAPVSTEGNWTVQCSALGSLSEDCSGATVHDVSSANFRVFSMDVFVKDNPSYSCKQGSVECRVRMSNGQACGSCRINDNPCIFIGQDGDVSVFRCEYAVSFNLTAEAVSSNFCRPVTPVVKSAAGRCSACGDGLVDAQQGEQCEPPNTTDNQYARQSSGTICSGKKSGVRDEFGYCTASCKTVVDAVQYSCTKGVCGAECSDGETTTVTRNVSGRTCTCVQQCTSACTWGSCSCEPPDISVIHSPQNPTPNQNVTITATTLRRGNYTIEIFLNSASIRICKSSPCAYSSQLQSGEHTYYAVYTDTDEVFRDPKEGAKRIIVSSSVSNATVSQPKINITSLSCVYDIFRNRYNVTAAASWSASFLHHGHIEIEGDQSRKDASGYFVYKKELASPGVKSVKALVHDANDSVVAQETRSVNCAAGTSSSDISITRIAANIVRLGNFTMRIELRPTKDIENIVFTENVRKDLIPRDIEVQGAQLSLQTREARVNYTDYIIYALTGNVSAGANITITYNITFASEGRYAFSSMAVSDSREVTESKVLTATSCAQTTSVYATSPAGVCQQFATSCNVPADWSVVPNCPSQSEPAEEGGMDFGLIIIIVGILVLVIVLVAMRHRIINRLEGYKINKTINKMQ